MVLAHSRFVTTRLGGISYESKLRKSAGRKPVSTRAGDSTDGLGNGVAMTGGSCRGYAVISPSARRPS